jgi:hypothetical protein
VWRASSPGLVENFKLCPRCMIVLIWDLPVGLLIICLTSLCLYPTVASKASRGLLHAMQIATSTPRAQQRAWTNKGKRLRRRHGQRTLECGTDIQMAKLKMLFKLATLLTPSCRVTNSLVLWHVQLTGKARMVSNKAILFDSTATVFSSRKCIHTVTRKLQ